MTTKGFVIVTIDKFYLNLIDNPIANPIPDPNLTWRMSLALNLGLPFRGLLNFWSNYFKITDVDKSDNLAI